MPFRIASYSSFDSVHESLKVLFHALYIPQPGDQTDVTIRSDNNKRALLSDPVCIVCNTTLPVACIYVVKEYPVRRQWRNIESSLSRGTRKCSSKGRQTYPTRASTP